MGSINITIQEQLIGVNDMTKMIGKVDTKNISNMEWATNEMDVFISEDKLILIEMVVDKLKTIETGDSVIFTYVKEPEDAIDLVCKMSS
jgi:hypothetical protein